MKYTSTPLNLWDDPPKFFGKVHGLVYEKLHRPSKASWSVKQFMGFTASKISPTWYNFTETDVTFYSKFKNKANLVALERRVEDFKFDRQQTTYIIMWCDIGLFEIDPKHRTSEVPFTETVRGLI